ncbi:hypothetical protein OG365_39565 (plasmid) [Streptomyces sp. NBC_00853]|uniref:hypothetical protein n=1 Tax=Streptomyces sp. NBC_00853 TaxID=2903681 RepID=UPI00387372F7|nr:hypothetical protein OG365_39565 [Streptomyces sp. NBC_00853]
MQPKETREVFDDPPQTMRYTPSNSETADSERMHPNNLSGGQPLLLVKFLPLPDALVNRS